jgi:hypothetical protein
MKQTRFAIAACLDYIIPAALDSRERLRRPGGRQGGAACRSGLGELTVMSAPLQQFRTLVLEDAALQQELRHCPDRPGFVMLLIARARERGHDIAPAEVEAALNAGAQAWLMRWIEQ